MDYLFDLHTHTIASGHAYSSMQEMIAAGKKKGLELLGISDHAPSMPGSSYIYYFQNLKVVPKEIDGLKIMLGVEANIINYQGHIDMSPENMEELDYVIASMHSPCIGYGTLLENTNAMISAMENPRVNIIGHPDDMRYKLDYEAVVKAAKENNVLLELNNASLNPKGFRLGADISCKIILELCARYEVPVIFGSDAHISYDVGRFDYCEQIIREVGFPKELIVNTSVDYLIRCLQKKVSR